MKKISLPLLGFFLLGFALLQSAPRLQAAANPTTSSSSSSSSPQSAAEQCTNDIAKGLAKERFLFDTMLFGNRHAAEEKAGATRVDEVGDTWIKNTEGKWVTNGKDAVSDDDMDKQTATDPLMKANTIDPQNPSVRPGILDTQKALTSDLIPPILQGFRAFQCRLESFCEGVTQTVDTPVGSKGNGSDSIDVTIPGCVPEAEKVIKTCQPSPIFSVSDVVAARTFCAPVIKKLTTYEEAQLLYLTHEDAAQRTLRQFAGFLEPLLVKLRFPFLSPLRQVSNFIGEWRSVSCFLPYCAQ